MAAGLYVLDARAPVQSQGAPLPHLVSMALCSAPPSPEGNFRDELCEATGYRRQLVEFGPMDCRKTTLTRSRTLRNRRRVVFGPFEGAIPEQLFAVMLDDNGAPVACGRLQPLRSRVGGEVIQFDASNIRMMSDRFRG